MNHEIDEFNSYVKNYDMSNKWIKLKHYHTLMVMKNCEQIAKYLNLTDEDIYLAKLIGLLHDIGRFEQAKLYNSLSDENMDHASYGVKLLFENNLIRNYISDTKYDEIIKFAIENHNKYKIEETSDNRKLMFAKIIRDADKIDIFRVLYTEINSTFDSLPSKNILNVFYNEKEGNNLNVKNNSDEIIIRLCFLYDLNYYVSFKLLNNYKYIDKYLNSIKIDNNYINIFNNVKNKTYEYINRRLGNEK